MIEKNGMKRLNKISNAVILLAGMISISAQAVITVTPAELAQKAKWVQQNLLTATNLPPFSFTYNGQSSSVVLPTWVRSETDTILDTDRTQHVITWTNNTLEVSCVATEYNDYPMVEWTVYLQNIGTTSTPILQGIQGLDITFSRMNGPEFVLNGNQGDLASGDGPGTMGYSPFQVSMGPDFSTNFSPIGGKSTMGFSGWPYYDLQVPGGGAIIVVGWPGQWASSFTRDSGTNLTVQAGQQLTHLILNPGEKIRTPLIALMFWQGTNVVRAQNIWRHWYLAHEIPRVNGQPPSTILQVQGDSTAIVQSYIAIGIQPNILWRDAGGAFTWYPSGNGPYTGANQWLNTGTWVVDPTAYPNGFHRTSAQVNALGCQFLLWFEPERIGNTNNSFLATNNPAWILPATSSTVGDILNEGNPGAFNWLTNWITGLIVANGINWYREDMNGDGPLTAWQNNDAANRQGIAENFYVQGHLAYWDALLAMNPGLRIDEVAGGGGRHDLENMRRAVTLQRSDFQYSSQAYVVEGNQSQTYGISSWLPFYGNASYFFDSYSFRSFYSPCFGMVGTPPANAAALYQGYTECKKIAPIMLNGDYYPLTPYSLADNVWMAWQFDWPGASNGCAQIFRRTNSPVASMTFQLQGLNASQIYDISNFDTGDLGWYAGSNLMTRGITLQLTNRQSAILYYTYAQGVEVTATANPAVGFAPLGVQFTSAGFAMGGGPLTYAWTFGDGGASTNQNPTHSYVANGSYLAQVTASDGLGNTNTAQITVVVVKPQYTMNIAFPGYTNAEVLTNFPVLVVLGANLTANGFSYSQLASSNGWDLMFMNSAGMQPLNYEIEKWNTNGNSYVWVQVPLLTSNTSIQVYWGDTNLTSAPAASTTNGSVWANGYVSVWHLGETEGTPYDSTVNRTAGSVITTYGTCTQGVSGEVGNGGAFNGGFISASAAALPGGSSPRTVSTWFQKNTATTALPGEEIVGYGDNTVVGDRFGLWIGGNGTPNALGVENEGSGRTFGWAWDSNWHNLAAVLPPGQNDLSGLNLYYDGTQNALATGSGPIDTVPNELCFAALPGYHTGDLTYDFVGNLDEVRISNVARSANWIWAEYMTMASNAVFNTYGAVTLYTAPVSPVQLTISGNGNGVMISWPAITAGNAMLQTSPDLITWTNSTAPVVINGSRKMVSITPESQAQFYRLAY
jgi:alpha-galactosidase